jgi:hypothetical protein
MMEKGGETRLWIGSLTVNARARSGGGVTERVVKGMSARSFRARSPLYTLYVCVQMLER